MDGGQEASLQLQLATQEKDRGGALYKEQKFEEARQAWLTALEQVPAGEDADLSRLQLSLHLNLSMVGLQLKEYEAVVAHASEALGLDGESSKAFFRRGLASEALNRVHAAAADLQKAARIEPKSIEIRRKYEELKKLSLEREEADEDAAPIHDLLKLPRVFLDVALGERPAARMVFALYVDSTPKTAENFRQLCAGEHAGTTARGKPFHYKGSVLHRVIPGLMVQGGDFDNANGTGGESIYGRRFADENFRDKHTRRGLLAMANDGPNTNGSNFFVTFAAAEHLDKRHVVFGELVSGMELLDELEKLETDPERRPLVDCVVTDCGECGPGGVPVGGTTAGP